MQKNKPGQATHLFPLTLYKAKIGLNEDEREILIREVYSQEKKSKNLENKETNKAWTGDTQGFEFIFSNKKFSKLFNLIGEHIKEYAKTIGLNYNKVDFYYQRAWATISRKSEKIVPHSHLQSHITFAYYLKKEKEDGKLVFHNEKANNEIVPGLFSTLGLSNFVTPNYSNAAVVHFPADVDEIVIFPSKTLHSTLSNQTSNDRISIAADISVVAKNSENIETLLTPVDKWVKF